jgi:cytochrome c oxidase accessory protein FixG
MGDINEKGEELGFRDRITTVDDKGRRKWLFPKKPSGVFHNKRRVFSWVLLILLFAGPWIRIGGEPLFLFDVLKRKFILFGQVFWTQDFHLFVLIMICMVLFIVLFTTVFGRLFCGWACPQTIFMEMVFRKIEYWIEGDYKYQKKLKKQKWNFEKVWKRVLKYSVFYFISLAISHTFLAYLIGSEKLLELQTSPLNENLGSFVALLIFASVFFLVFAWFREQVCLIVCPYGRLQGVMLDRNSLVIAYDYIRGESRSKFRKKEDRVAAGKGDCIDCNACVDVCPTGIDIRNGTQLECINCTACIDACDHIMDRIGKDKGLIRFDSENSIAENIQVKFPTRAKAYSVVLVILMAFIVFIFSLRGSLETNILRTPGVMPTVEENGSVSNLFNVKSFNKSNKDLALTFELVDLNGELNMIGSDTLYVSKGEKSQQAFFVVLPQDELDSHKKEIEIGVYSNGIMIERVKTNFLGSENLNRHE